MSASPQESPKSGPSRYAHLVRLAQVMAAFFILAGLAGWWATPVSWNYDIDNWYRRDALIAAQTWRGGAARPPGGRRSRAVGAGAQIKDKAYYSDHKNSYSSVPRIVSMRAMNLT